MEATELLKTVRRIEIKTRGLSHQIFAGEYHSAFKGRGMTFSEVREYQYGDDIRTIDWNVTARFNAPFVKIYEEERELTVMLLIDVSGSRMFGTANKLKKDIVTEIAAVLSFSAGFNNDKVGVIFFSDRVEKFIPPKKGRAHTLRIIRELIDFEPENNKTNISDALRFLTNAIKKSCTAFILSDMIDVNNENMQPNFEDALKIAGNKHDIAAIRIYDKREEKMPNIGMIRFKDAETGKLMIVDTSLKSVRSAYSDTMEKMNDNLNHTLSKCRIDHVSISTDEDYVKPLMQLFKKR
ncbi:MAG: DUF58 domain-containing protein [Prevotellaceae bacterium]|jgi:uncharacterized protein (DUF58 family)|nr:DUF58 domain-containing protein [Prevotellaceae bacterium]